MSSRLRQHRRPPPARPRTRPASPSSDSSTVSVLGQLLGALTVALPAIGVTSRFLAYVVDEATSPLAWRLAAAASIPQLALSGAYFVLPAVVVFGPMMALMNKSNTRGRRHRRGRVPEWMIVTPLAGVLVAILVFVAGFPEMLLGVVAGSIGALIAIRARRRAGRLTFANAWPSLATLVAMSILASALAGITLHPAVFAFANDAASDGVYATLGSRDDQTYLYSCSDDAAVVVRTADIVSERFDDSIDLPDARPDVSLWSVVVEGEDVALGIDFRCP